MPSPLDTIYRSTYAIRVELRDALQVAVDKSGANSVSDLLARIAQDPEGTGAALRPLFERLGPTRDKKVSVHTASKALKEANLSPEELARLMELAREVKSNG